MFYSTYKTDKGVDVIHALFLAEDFIFIITPRCFIKMSKFRTLLDDRTMELSHLETHVRRTKYNMSSRC